MRALAFLALAALVLAASTAALWSRTAARPVHFDDIPLVHYVAFGRS